MEYDNKSVIDYEKLKKEFERYQNNAEEKIILLSEKNTVLEKKLDSLTNVVEVSKYINSYVSDDNLIPLINDMIIGILGVTYSSIYIDENNFLVIKATNIPESHIKNSRDNYFEELDKCKPFVVNCKESLFSTEFGKIEIHSIIGIPITLRDRFIGYIIVEHSLFDFFNYDHIKFISSIANQIGIALENNMLYNKIRESSIKDPLINIYNRRYFFNTVEKSIIEKPYEKFSIVMIDLDNFKKFNDQYGHQYGDEVLIQTVGLINKMVGTNGIVARYGGEEIVIYIKNMHSFKKVYDLVENIRIKVSKNVISFNDIDKNITASFGLSFYPDDGITLEQVISSADSMLYEAKKSGKNKVVTSKRAI